MIELMPTLVGVAIGVWIGVLATTIPTVLAVKHEEAKIRRVLALAERIGDGPASKKVSAWWVCGAIRRAVEGGET